MRIIETRCYDEESAILDALQEINYEITSNLFLETECEDRNSCKCYNQNANSIFCPGMNGCKCDGITCIPNDKAILELKTELGIKTIMRYDSEMDYTFDVVIPF